MDGVVHAVEPGALNVANESSKYLVIDGSNIATEGRTIPSLSQLEGAVEEIRKELHETEVTVVVDATFAHRIDPSELSRYEEAALRGEYVSPPAGAIGRGDAFLLRIAEKVNATVLSNDSFQEFHGEHPWLFEPGRLLGATPVPGIGWIFVPRTPVRGPKSRVAVRDASRAKSRIVEAVAVATAEATAQDSAEAPVRRSRRRSGTEVAPAAPSEQEPIVRRPEAVNGPMPFISFIAGHPLGASVDGLVDSFTSHGAVIMVGDLRCYVPLAGLSTPPPRSAREVLKKGTHQEFLVTALDPARRGIELALPGIAVVRGVPSEETVAGEVEMTKSTRRRRGAAAPQQPAPEPVPPEPAASTTGRAAPKRAGAKKAAAGEAATKRVAAKRTAVARAEPAAKAPAKKAASAKTKPAARGTAAPKRASAKKAAPSRGAEALTTTGPRKRAATPSLPVRPGAATSSPKKAAPTTKAPAKQAAKKVPATKVTAKKAIAAKQAPTKAARTRPAGTASDEGPRRSGRS